MRNNSLWYSVTTISAEIKKNVRVYPLFKFLQVRTFLFTSIRGAYHAEALIQQTVLVICLCLSTQNWKKCVFYFCISLFLFSSRASQGCFIYIIYFGKIKIIIFSKFYKQDKKFIFSLVTETYKPGYDVAYSILRITDVCRLVYFLEILVFIKSTNKTAQFINFQRLPP